MKLTCNLDQRGRKARFFAGVIVDTLGTGLLLAGILSGRTSLIIAGIVCMAGGIFMIFEGAVGWCALRAMGFKTKL